MKQSRFTVSVTDDDGATILYHTLTQALALCPCGIDPSSQSTLAAEGFLVASNTDEPEKLRKRYIQDCATTENLCLAIGTTLDCNFACPYCYQRDVRHAGIMSRETQDAVVAFIERTFKKLGSKKLSILWYGGEPLLGINALEHISTSLINAGIPLEASIISNAALVDEAIAKTLVACKVKRATATLDGVGARHDAHRPSLSGAPSYDAIKKNLVLLKRHGIEVSVLFNEDRGNSFDFDNVRRELEEEGISNVTASQLFDYCQCLDKVPDFTRESYDLFENPREFALRQYHRATENGISDELLAGFMAPLRLFCSRQVESYFVIDETGLLYECDGDIGFADRARGSVFDEDLPSHTAYSPFTDPLCADCAYLPLCLGNCRWTRDCVGASCTPQKAIIREILHDWRALLDKGGEGGGRETADGTNDMDDTDDDPNHDGKAVRILRPGTAPDFETAEPFTLWL